MAPWAFITVNVARADRPSPGADPAAIAAIAAISAIAALEGDLSGRPPAPFTCNQNEWGPAGR